MAQSKRSRRTESTPAWLSLPLGGVLLFGCSLTVDVDALRSGSGGSGQGGATSSGSGAGGPTSSTSSGGGAGGGGAGGGGAGGGGDAYAASVLADGPIAYFRFEESAGTSCKNEIDGSPITCIYPTADVQLGAAGAAGRGHCLSMASARTSVFGSLDFPGGAPFTIELWVNASAQASGTSFTIFSDMLNPSSSQRTGTWLIVGEDGRPFTQTWVEGVHFLYTDGAINLAFDQWVHIALQHSEIDRLYVDLQTDNNGIVNPGYERQDNGVPLSLGGFVGCIDELAIYDYALPVTRMATHFAARSAD